MSQDHVQAYLDFYGLSQDPFSLSAKVYSPAGKRHEILEQLLHLNQFSHLSLVVLAPPGFGKSTLFNLLVKQLTALPSIQVASIENQVNLTAREILNQIAAQWGLGKIASDVQTLLRQLRSHNLSQSVLGNRHCVVVDDGEDLGEEALLALQELKAGLPEDQAIGLTIFSREAVVDYREYLKPSNEVHSIHLPALNNKEVFSYLQDYFEFAGLKQGVPFSPQEVEKIYLASEGIPGRIRQVTQDYMVQQALAVAEEKSGLPVMHGLAIGALVLVVGASFLLRTDKTYPPEVQQVQSGTAPVASVQEKLAEAVKQVEARQNQGATEELAEGSSGAISEGLEVIATTVPDSSNSTEAKAQPIDKPKANPPASQPSPKAEEPKETLAAEKPVVKPQPAVQPQPVPKAKVSPAPDPVMMGWLVSANPNRFTMQLLGVRTEKAVTQFIAEQRDPDQFAYYRTQFQEKPWYVVVYGDFSTRQEALAAVKKLPKHLTQTQPWIRTFESVRKSIKQ